MQRLGVSQALHYGIEEASVAHVVHAEADSLLESALHEFIDLAVLCCLDLAFEIVFIFLPFLPFLLELFAPFWSDRGTSNFW